MTQADPLADPLADWTALQSSPLLPGFSFHLAADSLGIWQTAERAGAAQPFWAFAWPAGIATARALLDRPALVAGRRVLDFGAGCGIASIAAARCGAARVIATDIDRLARRALGANAALNGAAIEITGEDWLAEPAPSLAAFDVLLISDVAYETALRLRVARLLREAHRRGMLILFADRVATPRPDLPLELLATCRSAVLPALEPGYVETAGVWGCNVPAGMTG